MTLVSVVIPTYNSSKYIYDTIESVINQTYENFEIIVVDDKSTDNTVDILRAINCNNIRIIVNKQNVGPAVTRNRGIDLANGDYIAFLDSDDLWSPNKLQLQVDFMRASGASFVYSKYRLIDEDGMMFADSEEMPRFATYENLLPHCFIRTSSIIYDVSAVGGKVYFPLIRKRQDFGLFLSLLRRVERAFLIDEFLCSYRIRRGSVSSNKLKNIKYQWEIYYSIEKIGLFRSTYIISKWFFFAALEYVRRFIRGFIKKDAR